MIHQSRKSTKGLFVKYLNICGFDSSSYILEDSAIPFTTYRVLDVSTRQKQLEVVERINNFDGVCRIQVTTTGNERVEDYIFINNLHIYFDDTIMSKRSKRLNKIRKRLLT